MSASFDVLHHAETDELRSRADALDIEGTKQMRRPYLIFSILVAESHSDEHEFGCGVLEIHGEGFGFLRDGQNNFLPGPNDIYVSQSQIRRFSLKTGDTVIGHVRPPKEGERYPALLRVESVNGESSEHEGSSFDALTAIYPDDHIDLSTDPNLRALDLVAPLGLGQRGLLVAPPRTGRVDLLRLLAGRLTEEEDVFCTVLLVGDRPEEIHEWRKSTSAEVIATPFDEPPGRHVQVADIVFERARRMAERGEDAILLVDSFTRLLRFCQAETLPTGRDVGGVDTAAMHRLRRYLGAARALEEGGSLTIIGVVSEPESRTGTVLLDDLRDVVNWEVTLTRDLADRGIRPPIDLHRSGTRQEERLFNDPDELARRAHWRATLTGDLVEDSTALIAYCAASGTHHKVGTDDA